MVGELTLVPAYGRDYKSKAAVMADWEGGKDFQIVSGPYASIRDVKEFPGRKFRIRYNKLREVLLIDIPGRSDKDIPY